MTREPTRRPPDGLGPSGRALWRQITSTFALEPQDPARLAIAARQLDVAAAARWQVQRDGAYLTNNVGQVYPHPGLAVEHRAQTLAVRCLRELGLDAASSAELTRPRAIQPRAG